MKSIIPEIYVKNCKEALEFYKGVFGGEVTNVQMTDGKEMFKGIVGKVLHSELHVNSACVLYFVDIFEGEKVEDSTHFVLEMDSKDEIDRVFEALKKDGSVKFELQKTFWGAYHAVVTDVYGNTWGLNYTER